MTSLTYLQQAPSIAEDDSRHHSSFLPNIVKTSAQTSSIKEAALELSSDEYEHDEDTLTEEEMNMIDAADVKIENDRITAIRQEIQRLQDIAHYQEDLLFDKQFVVTIHTYTDTSYNVQSCYVQR
jgi:hypothetical protein